MGLLRASAVVMLLGTFAVRRLLTAGPSQSTPQTASTPGVVEVAEPAPRLAAVFSKLFDGHPDLNNTCGQEVQARYKCTEPGCEDLVPGYINYIYFQECIVNTSTLRIFSSMLLVLWLLFLLHCVETTTNDYFCTSLQLAVAILKLSPNVAGVTFLAVGNAACDVIASIAAFATGVPKVGVGTTLGAGIFVTTAVVAAVSFVADVRLARRSFIRDVLFFIGTVVYLLYCTLDGIITVGEAAGFMIIYVVFVAVVGAGRFIRSLRTEDEGHSFGGSTGKEHLSTEDGPGGVSTPSVATVDGSYQSPDAVALQEGGAAAAEAAGQEARRAGLLSALEDARREAMTLRNEREIESLKREKTFRAEGSMVGMSVTRAASIMGLGYNPARPVGSRDENDPDYSDGRHESMGDGDMGGGYDSPKHAGGYIAGQNDPESGSANRLPALTRSASVLDDLPQKPSAWTSAFNATQEQPNENGEGGSARKGKKDRRRYEAYQMPSYHKRKIAKELAARLAERGIHHMVKTEDGRTVDIAELAVTDPDAASDILSKAASAITATAVKAGGALSFQDAAAVASESSGLLASGAAGSTAVATGTGGAGAGADLLAVLPKETIKPVADMYIRARRVLGLIGPYYSGMMHFAETPIVLARHLTIPLLHPGAYKRRLVALNMPFAFALFTFVFTTHIIKGMTEVGGVPLVVIAAGVGLVLTVALLWALPTDASIRKMSSSALLDKSTGAAAPTHLEVAADAAIQEASGGAEGHEKHWYSPLVDRITGPTDQPLPKGALFGAFLLLSFVMSLFWLLLIANELVGTALCFGKVLEIPDTVMGLVVLAVGNSINDLAASVTIAREGFPTMAVAGAYAGPMFNVLAGIGLPMLIYTSKGGDYAIGKDTPLVQMAFTTLLGSLTVTLIWVPLAGFRITHRIGRFLMAWFFLFILLVIIMGSIPGLTGDDDVVLAE